MNHTYRFFCTLLCCGLVLLHVGCASQGLNKARLDPEGERILDLLGYIVLPVEEKILREMPPEDRKEFVADFWTRRDPDLSTAENEYRKEYYTRMARADKAFTAGKPGWKTSLPESPSQFPMGGPVTGQREKNIHATS